MSHAQPASLPSSASVLRLLADQVQPRRRGKSASRSKKPGTASNPHSTVFLFGHQRELALYRAEVLAFKGFDVIVPRNDLEARDAILAGGFQVAVLSYTLPSHVVKEMADLVRQECPECPLLMISQRAEKDPHVRPDAIILADLGPSALVEAIRDTLRRRTQ